MLLTAWIGRAVLAGLTSGIVNDVGDPLLNAAILGWNAQSMPWTDAWYDFPIFYPTSGALTFSEHLLGLAPLATPLYWLTGSVLSTYNLALLLTFPLCAIDHVSVRAPTDRQRGRGVRLRNRLCVRPLSHRTAVAHPGTGVFWMPLAMLGLHEYVTSRRRRWLVLFAVAFALQGATNGYYLVFLTVFVGAWALWFVVHQRLWHQLAALVVAVDRGTRSALTYPLPIRGDASRSWLRTELDGGPWFQRRRGRAALCAANPLGLGNSADRVHG